MAGLLAGIVLLAVAAEDVLRYRIRNSAILLLLGCFALDVVLGVRVIAVWTHLLLAGVALAVLLVPFLLGGIGGGDTKLLAVALLWIGPDGLFPFAVLLILTTLACRAGIALGWLPARTRAGRIVIPFGASISAAWLALMVLGAA